MKILVCGGRDYNDQEKLYSELDKIVHAQSGLCTIISGCAKGADTLAIWYARDSSLPCEEYPADWKQYGRAAGHIRNQQMLDEGQPDLVVAFPGGRGTANMIERSKKAGVPVIEV